jgi:hypothetical protein
LLRIPGPPGQPQPQGIHRRTEVDNLKAGLLAHRRLAPIRAHGQIGVDLQYTFRSVRLRAGDALAILDQLPDLGLHLQMECRIALRLLGEEVQEVPLRHEGEEFAPRRQVREVGNRKPRITDLRVEVARFAMRPLQKRIEKSEFVHHLKRRGMDGVAAEVSQEISMLFEDDDVHPGAGEKKAEHHAGRPSTDDAALRMHFLARRRLLLHHLIPSGAIMSA